MKTLVRNSDITNLVRIQQIVKDAIINFNLSPAIELKLCYSKTHGYLIEFILSQSESGGILLNAYSSKQTIIGMLRTNFSINV